MNLLVFQLLRLRKHIQRSVPPTIERSHVGNEELLAEGRVSRDAWECACPMRTLVHHLASLLLKIENCSVSHLQSSQQQFPYPSSMLSSISSLP
ncbi:MAG TPA: hypothetical protein VIH78_14865 [Terriglobales bacterium]